jgi:hypothetical protein
MPHAAQAAQLREVVPSSCGELEPILSLLFHASVQTTERYLGCEQRLQSAVNDHIAVEPAT